MPDSTVVLYNSATGKQESVPADKAKSLIDSGDYYTGSSSTVRQGGVAIAPSDAGLRKTAGATFDSGASEGRVSRNAAHEESFNNLDDKAYAFSEAGIDALSFGLIHGHDDYSKENKELNSHAAFAGQLTGTALQLGLSGGAGAAEDAGALAMRGVAKEASTSLVARVGAKAIEDAAIGGAMGAAHAIGSGISDSIVENKPLTIEAVAEEAGIGTIMGFAGGGISGFLEKGAALASRAKIKLQGGLLDPLSQESKALVGLTNMAHGELDKALEGYSSRIGGLRELADQGLYPEELVNFRESALERARKAQAKLDKLDTNVINDSKSPDYAKWKAASADYHDAVQGLHEVVNRPGIFDQIEAGNIQKQELKPMSEGEFQAEKAEGEKIQDNLRKRDSTPMEGQREATPVDLQMGVHPELQERYKAIYGEDYEAGVTPADNGSQNLGGIETPTSNDRTNAGKVKGKAAQEPIAVQGGGTERLSPEPLPPVTNQPRSQIIAAPSDPAAVAQKFAEVKQSVFEPQVAIGQDRIGTSPGTRVEPYAGAEAKANFKADVEANKTVLNAKEQAPVKGEIADKNPGDTAKARVKEFVDRWYEESKKLGPRLQPFNEAEMRIHNMLFDLNDKTGGKLDTVAGTFNWRNAGSSLTDRIDDVRNLRSMSAMAADEARGVKTPLRAMAGKEAEQSAVRSAATTAAKMAANGFLGEELLGDKVGNKAGFLLGAALAGRYAGMAGKLASHAGAIAEKIRGTAASLLSGARSQALEVAASRNVAYQYTEAGPEPDALKRIEQVHELAQQPQAVIAKSLQSMGDLQLINPEIAQGLANQAAQQIQTIAMMAPAIYYNQLGEALRPNAEAMRKFLECENTAHNPSQCLDAIKAGSASPTQIQSLKISAPHIYMTLMQELMSDPDKIKKMGPTQLKMFERLSDQPMQLSSQPDAINRSMQAWTQISQVPLQIGKPQAFSLKTSGNQPTPAQSSTTAPGNQ